MKINAENPSSDCQCGCAAIFDFDGTIADTYQLLLNNLDQFEKIINVKNFDRNAIGSYRNMGMDQLIKSLGVSKIKLLLLISRLKMLMYDHILEIKPVSGIPDLLEDLSQKGILIGIVTSNQFKIVNKFLEFYGLIKYFSFIEAEPNLFGKGKKLKSAIKRRNLQCDKTIYIGDELRDIHAGNHAGIPTISVSWGYNSGESLEKANPLGVVDDVRQLGEEIYKYLDSKDCC